MNDRDGVIKGLECCNNDDCDSCPYFRSDDENDLGTCKATLHRDALTLLKAQEPVDAVPIDWLQRLAAISGLLGDEHAKSLIEHMCAAWKQYGYGYFEKKAGKADATNAN